MARERRRQSRERLRARLDEGGPSPATRWVHGARASLDEHPAATRLSAAFRWPTAAAYSTGSGGARAGSSRANTQSK